MNIFSGEDIERFTSRKKTKIKGIRMHLFSEVAKVDVE